MSFAQRLDAMIRRVDDFPKPGIRFLDLTPVFADAPMLRELVDELAKPWRTRRPTHVVGIEARGFILGAGVALTLGAGFVPARKGGKLPSQKVGQAYALEYGEGLLELHQDALPKGARVLVVDDLLATGGTAAAVVSLIERLGVAVEGISFAIELSALGGRKKLSGHAWTSLLNL
ncbi:MAG: adenine phosphoribosyltransferase [Myxococcaceae bacterium]